MHTERLLLAEPANSWLTSANLNGNKIIESVALLDFPNGPNWSNSVRNHFAGLVWHSKMIYSMFYSHNSSNGVFYGEVYNVSMCPQCFLKKITLTARRGTQISCTQAFRVFLWILHLITKRLTLEEHQSPGLPKERHTATLYKTSHISGGVKKITVSTECLILKPSPVLYFEWWLSVWLTERLFTTSQDWM